MENVQNLNRDYFVKVDVKTSRVTCPNLFFYITDNRTSNIFVQLLISMNNKDVIKDYVALENAYNYRLTLNIVKPNNETKEVKGVLLDEEKAIYLFDLKEECRDIIGNYKCEFIVACTVNNYKEQITSDSFKYTVKASILNDLDDIITSDEKYPILLDLIEQIKNSSGGVGMSNIWISEDGTEPPSQDYKLWIDLSDEDTIGAINGIEHELIAAIGAMSDKITSLETELAELKASDGIIVPDYEIIDAILTEDSSPILLEDGSYLMLEC